MSPSQDLGLRASGTLVLWILAVTTVASAQQPRLLVRLSPTRPDIQPQPPRVSVPGDTGCCRLEQVPGENAWALSLKVNQEDLVTPYVVSMNSPNVVALRVEFPSRVERQNQAVVLGLPRVQDASERTVRDLWSNNEVDKASDIEAQLQALQDLYFIVNQQWQQGARSSAATVRPAFLLLKVVRNLGEKTWYVVDGQYQSVVAHAQEVVRSADTAHACSWLGRRSCSELESLLVQLERLAGSRLGRIYGLIVPTGTSLDASFCTPARYANLTTFYDYFASSINVLNAASIRRGSGVSEVRVASAIASCAVRRATCGDLVSSSDAPEVLNDAMRRLEEASQVYPDPSAVRDAGRRRAEVSEVLDAITSGRPTVCSA